MLAVRDRSGAGARLSTRDLADALAHRPVSAVLPRGERSSAAPVQLRKKVRLNILKFDKETVIVIVVCMAAIFAWEPIARRMGWISDPPRAVATASAPAAAPAPEPPAVTAVPAAAVPAAAVTPAALKLAPRPVVTLGNARQVVTFQPASGTATAIRLREYKTAARDRDIVLDNNNDGISPLARPLHPGVFGLYGATPVAIDESTCEGDTTYVLRRKLTAANGARFTMESRWKLGENYTIDFELRLRNPSEHAVSLGAVRLSGGDLQPWTPLSGDQTRGDSHRVDYLTADGSFVDIATDANDAKFAGEPTRVKWAGISNKYFAVILRGEQPFTLIRSRAEANSSPTGTGATFQLAAITADLGAVTLDAKGEKVFRFQYYAGPKISSDLAAFDSTASRIMHLAWGPLDYLARLLLWLLVVLHGWCGSYGWSIILLTLIVRLLFWPLTAKGNASMRKMQLVNPKLQKLREQYKDNPQVLNAKMMELYKTEGVNPFGGCLPILLQIPVFFALYATLYGAVQLRQVSFLWAKDLALPDTICTIPLGFYDLPLNPLVIAMTVLMVVQQKLTPSAMDPAQQKMMLAMPVVMLLFLYDLPSGLTLYWTVSNIFSIVQMLIQRRQMEKAESGAPATDVGMRKSKN